MSSASPDVRGPIDIVLSDVDGRWHALYADGSLGPPLADFDELLDTCALLSPSEDEK
jgi:hypothetical protein